MLKPLQRKRWFQRSSANFPPVPGIWQLDLQTITTHTPLPGRELFLRLRRLKFQSLKLQIRVKTKKEPGCSVLFCALRTRIASAAAHLSKIAFKVKQAKTRGETTLSRSRDEHKHSTTNMVRHPQQIKHDTHQKRNT